MPSPYQTKTCKWCGKEWRTRSLAARTCSPLCRARLREVEHGPTKGSPRREYPEDIVDLAVSLYRSGSTVVEVQAKLPPGYKAQRIIERHVPQRRSPAKRDQRGPRNHMWKGDAAGYQAVHLRVEAQRGKPSECSRYDETEGRFEWANLTGNYADINDYARMCVSCHRKYDAARRRETGRRTSPKRR